MTDPRAGARVLERSVYRGPNLYGGRPMIRFRLDLGPLEAWPTDRIDGFADALLDRLPGLETHGCCYGTPGGFVRRLRDGTWLGHVAEHVALELQKQAGTPVTRGKTRSVRGQPGVYDVLYTYRDDRLGLAAGRCALELIDTLLPARLQGFDGLDLLSPPLGATAPFAFEQAVEALKGLAARGRFGPSTQALVDAARRRGIPVQRMNEESLVRLGWGVRQRRLRASVTDATGLIATELAGDKHQAKLVLAEAGCPVARGVVIRQPEDAAQAAAGLAPPWVTKPLDGNHGRGVTTGLRTPAELEQGVRLAFSQGRRILIEEQLQGRDYRILVVDGQVVAVAERQPAQVIGDGIATVRALVDRLNADPRRGVGHSQVLTRVPLDAVTEAMLAGQGLGLESVPRNGQTLALRTAANLSSGGEAIDRTDAIHPQTRRMAERAARAIGLDVAGIDLITPDISAPIGDSGGGIVEVNAAPGLRMHLSPSLGQARDVAEPIIRSLFPKGRSARIPIVAVTGTNGKSTVGRMVAAILTADGRCVGLTNTSGVYVGGERIAAGDASGPRSASRVLASPVVDAAVLECARGGMLREGLAFDRCDVGIVLNVQPDHLGLGGVDTLEDLARVKSIVSEAVARRGVCVLNADDPLTLRMARHAGGRLCWFSLRGGSDAPGFLQRHLLEGGLACLHDPQTGDITLHDAGQTWSLGSARDIPATVGGKALFNVANALAAAAAAHGLGVAPDVVRTALGAFTSDFQANPGRMNVVEAHGRTILLDYAHNPAALKALARCVREMTPAGGQSIAMISIPGDRREAEIRAMGEIGAQAFDTLVFRETPDNRGRPRGEVIRLMTEGAVAAGARADRLHGVRVEARAVEACLRLSRPGDVVVLLPTQIEQVWGQVEAYRAGVPPKDPSALNEPFMMEPPHG